MEEYQKAEIAELFKHAFSKRTIGVRWDGAKICWDGSLIGIEYAPAKKWLEERAAEQEVKRREAAKRAAVTRAQRREFQLYELVKRYLETGVFTQASNCQCCNKSLSDPNSERRGIGSECWDRFLKAVDKAKTHGAPVNEWDVTVDEIMSEVPRRENPGEGRCPVCSKYSSYRHTNSGKGLCSDCFDTVSLEAARRLRHTASASDDGGFVFREWIERERFVCTDPGVCEAQREATAAETRRKNFNQEFLRPPESREAFGRMYTEADRAVRDTRKLLQRAEKTARERFYIQTKKYPRGGDHRGLTTGDSL